MRHKFFWIGLLLIFMFPIASRAETVVAKHTPWSGYWWPKSVGGLLTGSDYYGRPSPLDKLEALDFVLGALVKDAYKEKYYNPSGVSWAGMCYEWALAASVEPEPKQAGVVDNVPFLVGDKKGLLTLAHSKDITTIGMGQDPVVFHSWLKEKLKSQGQVFVADLATGPEVWSYPVYKYDMTEEQSGRQLHVACTVYYPDDFVRPDYVGISLRQKAYTYTLRLDASANIIEGEWTGDSVEDHPELLTLHVACNPEETFLQPELLQRIMDSDDQLAGSTTLYPGTYPLTTYETRSFDLVVPESTETMSIIVRKARWTDQLQVTLVDQNGKRNLLNFDAQDEAHFLGVPNQAKSLELVSRSDQNTGLCTVILEAQAKPMSSVPVVSSQDSWIGVAQAAIRPGAGGMIVGRDLDGDPVLTYAADMNAEIGHKRVWILDMLQEKYKMGVQPVGLDCYPGTAELSTIILAGGEEGMLTTYGQGVQGRRLINPGIVLQHVGYTQYQPSLRNKSFERNRVHMRSYSNSGQLNDETSFILEPMETRIFSLGNSPLSKTSMYDWLLVEAEADIEMLGMARSKTNSNLGENIYAAAAEAQTFFVPHAPVDHGWKTYLTLINPQESPLEVTLTSQITGAQLGRMTVPAKGRLEQSLGEFPEIQILGQDLLKVSSSRPMAGYISYMHIADGDAVTLPLIKITDAHDALHIPHCPSVSPWWTGVVLGNISKQNQTVYVQAYTETGEPLPAAQQTIFIRGQSTIAFMTSDLIGPKHDQVGSILFTSDQPDTLIGFYLFGNEAQTMLTGYNF